MKFYQISTGIHFGLTSVVNKSLERIHFVIGVINNQDFQIHSSKPFILIKLLTVPKAAIGTIYIFAENRNYIKDKYLGNMTSFQMVLPSLW